MFFSWKIILFNFKHFYCHDFIQNKSEKFNALTFGNTRETSSWAHSGTFLAQKFQNKVIPKKIIWVNFKSLCCCNFMQKKKQKRFMYWLLIIPAKPHFGSLLAQKLQNRAFLEKKKIVSILSLYASVTWREGLTKIFPHKKLFEPILSLHPAVTSCKKSEKFCVLTFYKTQKMSIWADFEPI